jgi:uncharacterized glyoxalase superfamily protein PhnB
MTVPSKPEGFHTITPHMTIKNAGEAIAFYERAFGAELIQRCNMAGTEHVLHASMRIGDSFFMLNEEFPDFGALGPDPERPSAVKINLYVDDVDALFEQATKAGAKPTMPPADMFWGDRYATVVDPFGHAWAIAKHIEDVSDEEITERAKQAFAQGGECGGEE